MNRKLHNTLMAMLTSSALLVVTLLASTPAAPETRSQTLAATTSQAAGVGEVSPAARVSHGVTRRTYQSVRMPFFSFFLPKE